MRRISSLSCAVILFFLSLMAAPASAGKAVPVGGELAEWRELVFEVPPGWFRLPQKEDQGQPLTTFAAKFDGLLAVVTVSTVEEQVSDLSASQAVLERLKKEYEAKPGYTGTALRTAAQARVLGVDQSPYLTYQGKKKRVFVFFPPGQGESYNVNIVVPAGTVEEIPGFVLDFLAGLNRADAWQEDQSTAARQRLQEMAKVRLSVPPMRPSPFVDIETITQKQWDGAVAAAQQAAHMLYGRMSAEQEELFRKKWTAMRGFPSRECVDYLNALNPLLGEFLGLRTAINRTSGVLEQAMIEAGWAAELNDEPLTRQFLSLASRHRSLLYSLQNRLDRVAKKIADLGDPPDAAAQMAEAQKGYRRSKDYVRSLLNPAQGPEGVWVGYTKYSDGVFGLTSVKKEPCIFTVYNVAAQGETPRFRGIFLDDPEEETPERYLNLLPIEKFNMIEGFAKDSFRLHVEEDDGDSWTIVAQRQTGDVLPVFPGASLELYERETKKKLAALAEKRRQAAMNQAPSGSAKEDIQRLADSVGDSLSKSFTMDTLSDIRLHYRMRPAFLSASMEWLKTGEWGKDAQTDLDRLQALLNEHGGIANTSRSQKDQDKGQTVKETGNLNADDASKGDVPLHMVDDKELEERQELDREAVAFHEGNIAIISRHLKKDRSELAREKDPARRHALQQRILQGESNLQSERDRIASLKTGKLVHSRSPFDDYAKSRFIQKIAQDQRKMETVSKAVDNAYKLAERMPEEEARKIRNAADTHLGPELMANLDAERARRVVGKLYSMAENYWEAERNKAEVDAAWADAGLQTAVSVKKRADQAMEYTSMLGGQSVYVAYKGATGYAEGGVKESVLRVAESYNKVTGTVATAFRGYEEDGVKEAFLRVAGSYNDATSMAVDFYRGFEESGKDGDIFDALAGATWKMTKAVAIDKGTQFAVGRISNRFATAPKSPGKLGKASKSGKPGTGDTSASALISKKRKGRTGDGFNRPLTDQEVKAFRARVADGRTRVTSYKKTFQKLQKARKAKAPPKEIKKLLRELDDRAAKVHASPQAKIMMKNLQRNPKNGQIVKRYCNSMDRVHTRVEKRFRKAMWEEGWKTQEMVPIRNRASGRSVNMDYDIALKEKPWFDDKGTFQPWLTKKGEPVPVVTWQAEAQEHWNRAYAAETGQSSSRSFESVTTSKHHEAYADLKVLEKNGVLQADKGWAQQSGDVSQSKAWDLRDNPEFGRVEKYVEIARGTAKDAKGKLMPLLDKNRPKQGTKSFAVWEKHKNYWNKVSNVLEDMGSMKISPLEADRKIRLITGGKSVVEVTEDMGQLMSAAITLNR